MLEIDGSQQSGSGTIVRFAVALSALLGTPLQLRNARARRKAPGLRPQHLAAVQACAELCGGQAPGAALDARDFRFLPGPRVRGGRFAWDIGTAGSTTMLALAILPIACFASAPVVARIRGGVFQDFAPSPHHMQHVLAPLLARMGARVDLQVLVPGYVPAGAGEIELRVEPPARALVPLTLDSPGRAQRAQGIALSSHLAERRVSERMAQACAAALAEAGMAAEIEPVNDTLAARPGAALAIWTQTSGGARLGADCAGAPRRSSESIGRRVARALLADLASGATVDEHLADQLVLFAALAEGSSRYLVPRATDHLRTNLWLAQRFGARADQRGAQVVIDGLAVQRPSG
jgi:RNA 3'-terminal phosphate cyclase (ATP)